MIYLTFTELREKMAKKNEQNTSSKATETIQKAPNAPVLVHAQYLKDLSFENPNAPDSFRHNNTNPDMELNIALDVQKKEDSEHKDLFEVSMTVSASAKRDDKVLFIVECTYCALVSMKNIDEKQQHMLLFTEVPHTIFPFVRQIIADVTQGGGYIPLLLNPVDFRLMYKERYAKKDK